ncbi:MAG: amidohydrolase family protein, partial [Candidatus Binataceae bacterium]
MRVEGERIAGIGSGAPPRADGVIEIEAAGRVMMPGLIDAHAHLSIIGNITEQSRGSLPVRFLKIAREIEETLADGFTTVRDAGGLDWGYKEAIRQGLLRGPRLFVSNGVLSQTGGHGDLRPRTMAEPESQTPGLWSIG